MLKNLILIVAIFLVILLALSFGEAAFHDLFAWISSVTGVLIQNFGELFGFLSAYLHAHIGKVVLAVALTVPASLWILRAQRNGLGQPATQRRIAILLALFLGWLGIHRFYLGQLGWGIVVLIIAWAFVPLAALIGLIDAIRYLFMDEETFSATQLS
ncbi:MAG TPA: NINE protein [Castellaniella sp.]|uniref:TM2 domain-containing protein n=1 Tax=Castellaniella sp. TaxID=1955812 RepID=UPI002EFAE54C